MFIIDSVLIIIVVSFIDLLENSRNSRTRSTYVYNKTEPA